MVELPLAWFRTEKLLLWLFRKKALTGEGMKELARRGALKNQFQINKHSLELQLLFLELERQLIYQKRCHHNLSLPDMLLDRPRERSMRSDLSTAIGSAEWIAFLEAGTTSKATPPRLRTLKLLMSEVEQPMVGKDSTLIRNSTLAFYLRTYA